MEIKANVKDFQKAIIELTSKSFELNWYQYSGIHTVFGIAMAGQYAHLYLIKLKDIGSKSIMII